MEWSYHAHTWPSLDGDTGLDTTEAREKIDVVRLLAEHGVPWAPKDRHEANAVRRSFLKLKAKYAAEFVLIMTQHRACTKDCLVDLLRTPSMKTHVSKYDSRIAKVLASWE
jgi:hypothetical protein